ncbi:MAG: Crp/Fnr family transcriptional regulator [Bacillota bacterium]
MNAPTSTLSGGSTLEPMVRKLEYHGAFSDSDRAAVLALPFTLKTMERHHFVVRERELANHSSVLLSGTAVRSKIVATGHRQILSIHIRGETVDLQNSLLRVADHSVEMITAGRIAAIPRCEMTRLAFERPAIGTAMWKETLVDASIFREWLTNVGRRDARTRIAHLLCEFSLRLKVAEMGEHNGYELPMSQEQLGDATGLTSMHVNRTLKALERDGLIERLHPRSIHIGDWRKLAEAGDFDSGYLHLRSDEPALN